MERKKYKGKKMSQSQRDRQKPLVSNATVRARWVLETPSVLGM